MSVNVETIEFSNFPKCVRMTNGEVDLIIATDIGPRVLFFGYTGGTNVFKIFPEQTANVESGVWKSYGGHRLWHAPEVYPRTYYPDNEPVAWKWNGTSLELDCPDERGNAVGKKIEITLSPSGSKVTIEHRLSNVGVWPVKIAAWCLSVMAPGGKAIVPQEEYRPHPDCLVPARPLVLWHFTKMNDHRWTWGERYFQLREDSADKTKQKCGVRNSKGRAAYALGDVVFLKKVPFFPEATYTDMGCNQEFYTEAGFLEIETLSPYTELAPGSSITHVEKWTLAKMGALESEKDFDRLAELAGTM